MTRRFLNDPTIFTTFCQYPPFPRGLAIGLNKLESHSLKDYLNCSKVVSNWHSASGEEVENVNVFTDDDDNADDPYRRCWTNVQKNSSPQRERTDKYNFTPGKVLLSNIYIMYIELNNKYLLSLILLVFVPPTISPCSCPLSKLLSFSLMTSCHLK